jgi:hypothetical protein
MWLYMFKSQFVSVKKKKRKKKSDHQGCDWLIIKEVYFMYMYNISYLEMDEIIRYNNEFILWIVSHFIHWLWTKFDGNLFNLSIMCVTIDVR